MDIRMYEWGDGHLRPTLLGHLGGVDLIKITTIRRTRGFIVKVGLALRSGARTLLHHFLNMLTHGQSQILQCQGLIVIYQTGQS